MHLESKILQIVFFQHKKKQQTKKWQKVLGPEWTTQKKNYILSEQPNKYSRSSQTHGEYNDRSISVIVACIT